MNSNTKNIQSWSLVPDEEILSFGDEGDPARQYILTPTILDLAGNVDEKKVLDAGCGNGYLSRKLARLGSNVVGIEPATNFFNYCIQRESEESLGISYKNEDISRYVFKEKYFDLVVANMVFMDIDDYENAIINCIKSLKNEGELIISISHPCFPGSDADWNKFGYVKVEEYFNRTPQKNNYGYSYDRPIQDYINLLLDNGCSLNRLVEPQVSKEIVENDKSWDRNYHVPQFLFVKARKE